MTLLAIAIAGCRFAAKTKYHVIRKKGRHRAGRSGRKRPGQRSRAGLPHPLALWDKAAMTEKKTDQSARAPGPNPTEPCPTA